MITTAMLGALPLFLALLPGIAFASEGEVPHGGAPTQGQWVLLFFTVVNFLIFVGLFRYFTKAPLRDFLASRRKQLVEAMAEASRAKAEADRVKKEYEIKAAGLEKARADLIAEVRGIAESDRDQAIRSANEAAARLMQDVQRTAESDLSRARLELRSEAARLANEIAEKEIASRMDSETRNRLLKDFLAGVER